MKIAVVGATGMVGRVMLQVLEERNFPVTELLPVASERSIGSKDQIQRQRIRGHRFRRCRQSETRHCPLFCRRWHFPGMGATVRRSWHNRDRQLFGLEDGSRQETGSPGDQRFRNNFRRQDHCQPQLFHYPNGDGFGAVA